MWKLYPAQQKQSGMAVTVFVLQKDNPVFRKMDKAKAEQLFQAMRKDIKNLQAQGHGRILRILEVKQLRNDHIILVFGGAFHSLRMHT